MIKLQHGGVGADVLRPERLREPQALHGLDPRQRHVDLAEVKGVLQHQLSAGESAALALVDGRRPVGVSSTQWARVRIAAIKIQ